MVQIDFERPGIDNLFFTPVEKGLTLESLQELEAAQEQGLTTFLEALAVVAVVHVAGGVAVVQVAVSSLASQHEDAKGAQAPDLSAQTPAAASTDIIASTAAGAAALAATDGWLMVDAADETKAEAEAAPAEAVTETLEVQMVPQPYPPIPKTFDVVDTFEQKAGVVASETGVDNPSEECTVALSNLDVSQLHIEIEEAKSEVQNKVDIKLENKLSQPIMVLEEPEVQMEVDMKREEGSSHESLQESLLAPGREAAKRLASSSGPDALVTARAPVPQEAAESCWLLTRFQQLANLAKQKAKDHKLAVQAAAAARKKETELDRALRESDSLQQAIDASASDARERLQQTMDLYQAKARPVKADGNCQFRALSLQLYGDEEHHGSLRARVVVQLEAKADLYGGFVHEPFADYLKRMAQECQWGDNVTLQAASDLLGVDIHILTDQPHSPHLVVHPGQEIKGSAQKPLCLTFLTEIHYDAAEFLYSLELNS